MITDIVDPPKTQGKHPVMSADLERVLTAIQKGGEERLEVLRIHKKKIEQGQSSGGMVPKLIGHIEKMEPQGKQEKLEDEGGAVEEENVGDNQMASMETAGTKEVRGRQTADREVGGCCRQEG